MASTCSINGILEKIKIVGTEKETINQDKSNCLNFPWIVGDEIEAKDFMKKWYRARIMARNKKHGGRILVHFQGWSTQYDEWLPVDSDRIRPIVQLKNEFNNEVKKVEIGEIIYAPWRDGRIYPGKIIHSTRQSCFVRFYDGMCRKVKTRFIFKMNDKEKDDYLKEGYFKGSIFSLKTNLNETCKNKKLNQSNISNKKNDKMIFKKIKFGKHKMALSKGNTNEMMEPEFFVDESDGCSEYKKLKTDLSSNSTDSKSSKKRKNSSSLKKSEMLDKDSGPKVRCSFCQNYHEKFVSRPALNAMTQCYICLDCKLEYDERLRANHMQAINEWLISGKLPSFQIDSYENKNKKKDDSTTKNSNEFIMKATNDVIAEITNIQKTLSYIDQAILLLKDEKNTEELYFSLLKNSNTPTLYNSTSTITENVLKSSQQASLLDSDIDCDFTGSKCLQSTSYSDNFNLQNQSKLNTHNKCEIASNTSESYLNKYPINQFGASSFSNYNNSSFISDEKSEVNKDKLKFQTNNISNENSLFLDSANLSCNKSLSAVDHVERQAEFSRKIKADLARMQAELARKILSIDSTVGVLEAGVDYNNSNGREKFKETLNELKDLALIANFI